MLKEAGTTALQRNHVQQQTKDQTSHYEYINSNDNTIALPFLNQVLAPAIYMESILNRFKGEEEKIGFFRGRTWSERGASRQNQVLASRIDRILENRSDWGICP